MPSVLGSVEDKLLAREYLTYHKCDGKPLQAIDS